MRLGTTSFIFPADLATNARKLVAAVQDVELIIFEAEEYGNNYPDRETVRELGRIAADHDLTYTVHLPLNLNLASDAPRVETALRVIDTTMPLNPLGFIVHADQYPDQGWAELDRLVDNSIRSLEKMAKAVDDPTLLCIENLDNQPPIAMDKVLEQLPVGCCVDIGHLWKQGLDALPHLSAWLKHTRVVHLHGIGSRDHEALSLIPADRLDPVVEVLHRQFHGVVTLEVFSEQDLMDSLEAFRAAVQRVGERG